MRKVRFLPLILFFLASACSSVPKYSAFDGQQGYQEKQIATGAYMVTVQLPEKTNELDISHYLLLRIAELCEKEGASYFHTALVLLDKSLASIDQHNSHSELGLCSKTESRYTLNIDLADDGKTVQANINSTNSALVKADVIEAFNGELIRNTWDLKLALHNFGASSNVAPLKIKRAGSSLDVKQPIGLTKKMFGPEDYKRLKRKFYN